MIDDKIKVGYPVESWRDIKISTSQILYQILVVGSRVIVFWIVPHLMHFLKMTERGLARVISYKSIM